MKRYFLGGFLAVAVFLAVGYITPPSSVHVAGADTGPSFTQGGVQTNSVTCGAPLTFDVPGQTQIWLTQLKSNTTIGNNQQTFDGVYTVPSTYTPDCTRDLGTFQNSAYTLVGGQKGTFLGTAEATVKSSASSTSGEVTIGNPVLRTCFDHLAAVGGVLQSSDPTLSPGEWLIHVMNTQPAFRNNPITSASVDSTTLSQVVAALNTSAFGGPHYYFDSNACVGFRSDGVAYGPNGYVSNWMGYPLNTNRCPSWWTGNDSCGAFNPVTSSNANITTPGGNKITDPLAALQAIIDSLRAQVAELQAQLQVFLTGGGNSGGANNTTGNSGVSNAVVVDPNACRNTGTQTAMGIIGKEGPANTLTALLTEQKEAASSLGLSLAFGTTPLDCTVPANPSCALISFQSACNILNAGFSQKSGGLTAGLNTFASGVNAITPAPAVTNNVNNGGGAGMPTSGSWEGVQEFSTQAGFDGCVAANGRCVFTSTDSSKVKVSCGAPMNIAAGNAPNHNFVCVGDTITAHIPSGFKYLDKTYTGPAIDYSLTMTDVHMAITSIPFMGPQYQGPGTPTTLARPVVSFDAVKSGSAQSHSDDYFDPDIFLSGQTTPDQYIAFFAYGSYQGSPTNYGVGPGKVLFGTDMSGKKFTDVITDVRRKRSWNEPLDGCTQNGYGTWPCTPIDGWNQWAWLTPGGYGAGGGTGSGSGNNSASSFVCPDAPRSFNMGNSGQIGETYFCIGDEFAAYVPAGSSGQAMNYQFTLKDIVPNQTVANDPLYHFYDTGPVTGNVATFSLSINGAAPTDVTDYLGPQGVNVTSPGPNDAYYLYIEGDKVPVGVPILGQGPVVGIDKNGKKYGSLVYSLLQHVGTLWQVVQGGTSLPPCNANSCGSAYGGYFCAPQTGGQFGWIVNNDYMCSVQSATQLSCPNQNLTCVVVPGNFYGHLSAGANPQPGVSCAQDSDCTAPSATSTAYCVSGHCACGTSKVQTLFGYAVMNQVACTVPAAGNNPTSCSLTFTPGKASYCVGDTVQYSVTSVPPGINAYVYRSKNGVLDVNGSTVAQTVTNSTTSYTYKPADVGNYDVYYRVDAGGGHTCDTNHVVTSVKNCSSTSLLAPPPLARGGGLLASILGFFERILPL